MSVFHGPMRDRDGNVRSPRDMREHRATKRLEAEVRNEDTAPARRRKARRFAEAQAGVPYEWSTP